MIKKSLFILLLLGFISISSNAAEDIKDIQVDGISIGDKVLNHLSKSEYKQNIKEKFYKDKNVEDEIISKTYKSVVADEIVKRVINQLNLI